MPNFIWFAFSSCAIGTLIGVLLGDKFGRKYVIWFSVLGSCTVYIITIYGFVLTECYQCDRNNYFICISSNFKAYAQDHCLKTGMVSGLFYGFVEMGGLGSALLGNLATHQYYLCL
jgi:FSR family fosmidomycin resistance protein-like MFS transporter